MAANKLDEASTAIWALDALCRYAPAPLETVLETAAAEHDEAQVKRELARLHSLPRVRQSNPCDECHDCGAEASHSTYRNGRPIGLCDDCYGW